MGVNSLPKTVTRQRRGCDLNPGPTASESSTLTTRLPSHPLDSYDSMIYLLQAATYVASLRAGLTLMIYWASRRG